MTTNTPNKYSNIFDKLKEGPQYFINLINDKVIETNIVMLISYTIVIVIIISAILYGTTVIRKNNSNCNRLQNLYNQFPKLSSIDINNDYYSYNLRDYYIKTAYNACCAGNFKNDYVNICALKNAIKQGARCLDFEIYSVNDKPVIAVSDSKDYFTKGTYNSIPFESAMDIIANYAFSNGTCPNFNDPLLLNFRIMSNNKKIYDSMAKILYSKLQNRMLDKQYSYEYEGKNLSSVPITTLAGKVIIIVDRKNSLYQETPLNEYINMASSSVFLRNYNFSQIKNIQDYNELIEYNKKNMTIITPDNTGNIQNPSSALGMTYGCQFIAMALQKKDNNLDYYNKLFEDQNSAFILKPENLRYIPVTIPVPPPPNPKYSYAKRSVKTDAYSFDI